MLASFELQRSTESSTILLFMFTQFLLLIAVVTYLVFEYSDRIIIGAVASVVIAMAISAWIRIIAKHYPSRF